MRLQLSDTLTYNGCQKPGCKRTPVYRHHTGSERMWVNYFRLRSADVVYQEFCARYERFEKQALSQLCGDHHEEVHAVYWSAIHTWISRHRHPLGDWFEEWSYQDANRLMDHLREVHDEWIKRPTPGLKRRKYTGRE